MESWDEVIDELHRIQDLQNDWDGLGGLAPTPSLAAHAIELAGQLRDAKYSPPTWAAVNTNGVICFEWMSPLGYWVLEIASLNEFEYYFCPLV